MPYIILVAPYIWEEIIVFGNDYNTLDGTDVLDYIYKLII